MKRIICCLLTVVMTITFASCSRKADKEKIGTIIGFESFETEMAKRIDFSHYDLDKLLFEHKDYIYFYTNKNPNTISKSSSFNVTIDGTTITMPITVGDLVDKGFVLTEVDSKPIDDNALDQIFESKWFDFSTKKGNNLSVRVVQPNGTTNEKLKDCLITQITDSFYKGSKYTYDQEPCTPQFCFFKNITNKSTVDDIVRELGEPTEIKYNTLYGDSSVAAIQLLYNFSNDKHTGHISFTTLSLTSEDGKTANLLYSFTYEIDQ